jgi:hypothetical protein
MLIVPLFPNISHLPRYAGGSGAHRFRFAGAARNLNTCDVERREIR